MITREEAKEIAEQVVSGCRIQVDGELARLKEGMWTEERAKRIAQEAGEMAAGLAVQRITDNVYMSIGKKTVVVLGATVVTLIIFLKEELKAWITGKRA